MIFLLLLSFAHAQPKTYAYPCVANPQEICVATVEGYVPEPNYGLVPLDVDGKEPDKDDLSIVRGRAVVVPEKRDARMAQVTADRLKAEAIRADQESKDQAARVACKLATDPITIAVCTRLFK